MLQLTDFVWVHIKLILNTLENITIVQNKGKLYMHIGKTTNGKVLSKKTPTKSSISIEHTLQSYRIKAQLGFGGLK